MQKEIINQAIELFDTHDKWYAYLELVYQKDQIRNTYLQRVKQPLLKYFVENPVDGWVCEPWGDTNYDLRWYLKDFGKKSLALALGWRFEFHLHLEDTEKFDSKKIDELLKSEYALVLSAFDRIDRQFETTTKAMEFRNYSFDCPLDYNFDNAQIDKFAWYAGNHTESLVEQIIRKVERFRRDEQISKMLYEINEKSKIIK